MRLLMAPSTQALEVREALFAPALVRQVMHLPRRTLPALLTNPAAPLKHRLALFPPGLAFEVNPMQPEPAGARDPHSPILHPPTP